MVLRELWSNKKPSVARVTALKALLDELNKAPASSSQGATPEVTLPAWMTEDDKAAE
jgi:hypothetical protein